MAQVIEMAGYFHSPSCIQVIGGTSSGKSTITQGILQYCQALFDQPIKGILFAHDSPQDLHTKIENTAGAPVTFYQGLPADNDVEAFVAKYPPGSHLILVLDDLMTQTSRSSQVSKLYFNDSHHLNINILELKQNCFEKGPHSRTQSLQCSYFVLTRNNRDTGQIRLLGRQLFGPGEKAKRFLQAYEDAMSGSNKQYPQALLVSAHPWATHPQLRLMSNFLPPGGATIVYHI
jgi:hypothetical protein